MLNVRSSLAGSTGRRNIGVKSLCWVCRTYSSESWKCPGPGRNQVKGHVVSSHEPGEVPWPRNSQPALAISNRLQNRWPLLQDALIFDPVQAPSLRYAFELVIAAIFEADSRLRH